MKYFADFERSNISYSERLGEPDEFSSAFGLVAMAFSQLEQELSHAIHKMLHLTESKGNIVTAELSFRNKLDLISSLFHELKREYKFNTGSANQDDVFKEFLSMLKKCAELRNQITHSLYLQQPGNVMIRRKITAKAKHGLKIVDEEVSTTFLLDTYDFIVSSYMYVEEILLVFEERKSDLAANQAIKRDC